MLQFSKASKGYGEHTNLGDLVACLDANVRGAKVYHDIDQEEEVNHTVYDDNEDRICILRKLAHYEIGTYFGLVSCIIWNWEAIKSGKDHYEEVPGHPASIIEAK